MLLTVRFRATFGHQYIIFYMPVVLMNLTKDILPSVYYSIYKFFYLNGVLSSELNVHFTSIPSINLINFASTITESQPPSSILLQKLWPSGSILSQTLLYDSTDQFLKVDQPTKLRAPIPEKKLLSSGISLHGTEI